MVLCCYDIIGMVLLVDIGIVSNFVIVIVLFVFEMVVIVVMMWCRIILLFVFCVVVLNLGKIEDVLNRGNDNVMVEFSCCVVIRVLVFR